MEVTIVNFDKLKMYFGEPYDIQTPDGSTLTVLQPTIGNIIACGEEKFYSTLSVFVTNTTSYRSILWDGGIDWNEIKDFDLFILLYRTVNPEVIKLLFRDVDFSEFALAQDTVNGEIVLRNPTTGMVINNDVYEGFHRYLQEMFKMKPEDEFTKDPLLKKWWVEKDKRESQRNATKKDKKSMSIQPMISAAVNHPGFKYKLQELRDVGVCEFYDSIQRLQLYENSIAVLHGLMGGFVDGSKIKPEQYNFMKEI